MGAMDRLRAAAKEAADYGRAGLAAARAHEERWLGAGGATRHTAAGLAAARAATDGVVGRAAGTATGGAVGQGARAFGRWAQRMPLLTAPTDLIRERHNVEVLFDAVGADPNDVLAHLYLGEALAAMEADLGRLDLVRVSVNPTSLMFREALRTASTIGSPQPQADPAAQVLKRCEALAALRLHADCRDPVALHALARVRIVTGNAGQAVQPAKLAVAASAGPARGAALVTLARAYTGAGQTDAAQRVARKAVDAGCSVAWEVLADLLYRGRSTGDERSDGPRHREHAAMLARVSDADRLAYHGFRRRGVGETARAALDAQWGRVKALRSVQPQSARPPR
jgi:hypothetical protein